MPVVPSFYRAPAWCVGRHVQTIVPSIFREVEGVEYVRERITTEDADFLDLDWSKKGHKRLAILSHGLEGNSTQQYMLGMAKELNAQGWDVLAWNYRSCSGELNTQMRFYHAGSTGDLKVVIHHAIAHAHYKEIALIGFSLGGNVTLKYLGELGANVPKEIVKAVAFSVPCDLKATVHELSRGFNKIYLSNFMSSLKCKIIKKAEHFPEIISGIDLSKVQTLMDYDNYFTAPLGGFKNADHYYRECSTVNSIEEIRIPTLIVTARNDPLLPHTDLPYRECMRSRYVSLETPDEGGHLGFIKKNLHGRAWSEERALDFLNFSPSINNLY